MPTGSSTPLRGGELEGRDLFTGAGQPVDPDHAIRDLRHVPGAVGEARQYALDHPDSTPEHTGLFPEWVAEAARTNADALTELTEPAEPAPASEASGTGRQWISVVFLQGEEADQVLDAIDRDGTAAALEHPLAMTTGTRPPRPHWRTATSTTSP